MCRRNNLKFANKMLKKCPFCLPSSRLRNKTHKKWAKNGFSSYFYSLLFFFFFNKDINRWAAIKRQRLWHRLQRRRSGKVQVSCVVWLLTPPTKKKSKNSRGKNRQQFPSFFDHSDSIQIQSWLGQKARRRRFSFKR